MLAVAFAALVAGCAAALAADPLDRGFGKDGVASEPTSAYGALVWDLAADRRGRLLAAVGSFTEGGSEFRVTRFRRGGALDRTFSRDGSATNLLRRPGHRSGYQGQAQAIAVQRDGKVIVVGYIGGRDPHGTAIVRLRPNGRLDRGFGRDGSVVPAREHHRPDGFHDVAVEPSGRIIAVGGHNEVGRGRPAALIVAYRPDGSRDRSFGENGRVLIPTRRGGSEYTGAKAVELLPGGKILVAGYIRNQLFVARLSGGGALDRTFGGGDGVAVIGANQAGCYQGDCSMEAAVAVQPDGRIVLQGESLGDGLVLARLLPDGQLDPSFGRGGRVPRKLAGRLDGAFDMAAVGRRGKLLVAGIGYRRSGGKFFFRTMRFDADGHLDRRFARHGVQSLRKGSYSVAHAVLPLSGGRAVVGGSFLVPREDSYDASLLLVKLRP